MGNCDSRVLCKIISHDVLGETQSSSEMELIPIILTRNPGLECSPIVNIVSQLMNHNKRSETQKSYDIQRISDGKEALTQRPKK